MTRKGAALLIFTKSPIEGRVKTRLIPEWGTHGALLVYQDLIKTTIETAKKSSIKDIVIYATPDVHAPFLDFCANHYELQVYKQHGSDLGEKMHNAFEDNLSDHSSVIIIGCDCPDLKADDLNAAVSALDGGHDIVIGPSEDGGYYLIGLRKACRELFKEMSWGEGRVMRTTRERIAAMGLKGIELDVKWDVDRPEDVDRYMGKKYPLPGG